MTPEQTAATVDTPEVQQNLAQRLRAEREAQQWSINDVSQRLHLPHSIIVAMEMGNLERLGPAVFARGHYRSYLRLLGLPELLATRLFRDSDLQPVIEDVPGRRSPRRFAERLAWGMSTMLVTGLVAANVWYWVARHQTDLPSLSALDMPSAQAEDMHGQSMRGAAGPVDGAFVGPPRWAAGAGLAPTAAPAPPVMASMTPFSPASSTASTPASVAATLPSASQANSESNSSQGLRLRLSGESWVEIRDASGRRLEFSLLREGVERQYALGDGLTVLLGNARAVSLEVDGQSLDVNEFINANVANFLLSNEGQLSFVPAG